jgi:SAM-dependent methyltransferase
MVNYSIICGTKSRIKIYPYRRVSLPVLTRSQFGTTEYEQWIADNDWMVNYEVFMNDKTKAVSLSQQLEGAFLEDRHGDVEKILSALKKLRSKPYDELSPVEVWTRSAYNLAEYAGSREVRNAISKKLCHYKNRVLEAMCGHTTYFDDAPDRQVVSLDYCQESLERHICPNRLRVKCDLNEVTENNHLYFQEGEFDAVSISFGFKYLERIDSVLKEFWRVLKPAGFVSFIENPAHGYEHLCKRQFIPDNVASLLLKAGFQLVTINKLQMNDIVSDSDDFYHVEAIK